MKRSIIVSAFLLFICALQAQNVMIFQPSAGANDGTDNGSINAGKDTRVSRDLPTNNYGSIATVMGSPRSNCNECDTKAYFQFDITGLPTVVDSVFFGVTHSAHTSYCYSNCSADFYIYEVTSAWDEMALNYTNAPTENPTAIYGPIPISFPNDFGTKEYEITSTYNNWVANPTSNYGFVVYSPMTGCNNASVGFIVGSSDNEVESSRPYLKIYYTPTAKADFTVTENTCSNTSVNFTNNSIDTDTWLWIFNDGDSSTVFEPNHNYTTAGNYEVKLIASDSESGRKDSISQTVTVNPSYGLSIVAPENLIAYYPLDGNAIDESNYGHNGIVYEAVSTADRNGVEGKAMYFDGTNNYIDIGDWENGGAMSFTFWARWDALNNWSRIIDLGNGQSSSNIIISNSGTTNNILFDIWDGSTQYYYNCNDLMTVNNWVYIACTVDSSGLMKTYKNGTLECTFDGVTPQEILRTSQYVGRSNWSVDGYFKGAIDELKIYNKSLSAMEVLMDYQGLEDNILPPIEMEICASDTPYVFGTQNITESGKYFETFQTIHGCDSTIQLNLTVHPVYHTTVEELGYTHVDDSFENDSVGTLAGWAIKYDGSGTANQKVVNTIAKNGLHSLQLEGQSSWAADVYKPIIGTPENLTIEAWINPTISNAQGSGIGLVNYGAATWGARTSRISFSNGRIVLGATNGLVYDIQAFTPNQWYHVRMVHDMVSHVYSVYIDGQKVSGTSGTIITDVFPMYAGAESQDLFLCAGNATTTRVYFDDVRMYESSDSVVICSNEAPYVFGTQNINESGTYYETFQTVYGCDSIVQLNITVYPAYNMSVKDSICPGSDYIFPDSTEIHNITEDISHISNLVTVHGCDSIITTQIKVNPIYNLTDTINICRSELPYTYRDTTFTVNTTSGDYIFHRNTINGCDSIVNLTLKVIELPDTSITQKNDTLTVNLANAAYQWIDCDNGNTPIEGETGQSFTPTMNGHYAVQITSETCTATSSCYEVIITAVDNIFGDGFKLYPNPTNGYINIDFGENIPDIKLSITDITGRTLLTKEYKNRQDLELSLHHLSSGIYFIHIIKENKTATFKVIKNKL